MLFTSYNDVFNLVSVQFTNNSYYIPKRLLWCYIASLLALETQKQPRRFLRPWRDCPLKIKQMQGFTALLVRLSSRVTCSNNCLIPQDIVVLILSANKRTNVKILNGTQLTANPITIAMESFSAEFERSLSVRLVLSGTFKKIARHRINIRTKGI